MKIRYLLCSAAGTLLCGCAVTSTPPAVVDAPVSRPQQVEAQAQAALPPSKILKRKVAIGRFSNETRYGRTFQTDASLDPLGKQASDMLSTRLIESKQFLVFERPDVGRIEEEQKLQGDGALVGVDTMILGAVTEFGRSTTGKSGFLSSTKVQTAHAKVEIRLVDVHTGLLFFSASGSGDATTESGEVAGFGSSADYDGTLNDRAIAAAISDVISTLINKLVDRPWRTDILQVSGSQVFISGGSRQGINSGDVLQVMQEGAEVTSRQTGFRITLPGTPIGQLKVISTFGDSESNEGSVAQLISGTASPAAGTSVYVTAN